MLDLCAIQWKYRPASADFLIGTQMLAVVQSGDLCKVQEAATQSGRMFAAVLGVSVNESAPGRSTAGLVSESFNGPGDWCSWKDLSLDRWNNGEVSFEAQPILGGHPDNQSDLTTLWNEAGARVFMNGAALPNWFRVVACYADGSEIETALIAAPSALEPNYGATDCEQFGILIGRIEAEEEDQVDVWKFNPETDIPSTEKPF